MLVISRRTSEAVIIGDAYTVTPREITERSLTLDIEAVEPFHLHGNAAAEIAPTAAPATQFECILTRNGMAWIEEDFYLVLISTRLVDAGGGYAARLGLEGPRGTKFLCHYANGRESKPHVMGEVMASRQ